MAAAQAAAAALNGTAVRCVDWRIFSDPTASNPLVRYGDGFSRLAPQTPAAVLAAVQAAASNPAGAAALVPSSFMAGANVWLLQALAGPLDPPTRPT